MVSGSVSLPCAGYFSPFPHGTGSLSVSQEYLALPDGTGWFTQDFSGPALLRMLTGFIKTPFVYRAFTVCGLPFQVIPLKVLIRHWRKSYNPITAVTTMVWAVPRSLATTWGITIVFFSYGYLDVSVPHVRLRGSLREYPGLRPDGLPHSEISGSQLICS